MKKYRLLKDLPTFKAGDEFFIDPENGSLYLDHSGGRGYEYCRPKVMAYHKETLEKFPNILEDWFEEIEKSRGYWYLAFDGDVMRAEQDYQMFWADELKQIGNYFETAEEAEKAVEKLKAWKRLRDIGYSFDGWDIKTVGSEGDHLLIHLHIKDITDCEDDLALLFGGEE